MAEGGLLPPIIVELKAKSTELKATLAETKGELSEVAKESEGTSSRMGGAFGKAAGYGKTLALGIGGAALAVGGFAVEAATSAQVVDAKLSTAIKNAGGSMEELEPKIASVDAAQRKLGFTNDQTNTALASLTTALKDPEKAMGAMSVAADLARAKNISLNDAAMMVAKGMEGQTRPLKQLGIDLPVYAGNAQAVKLAQDGVATAQQKVNDILAKTPDAADKSSKAHAAYEKAVRGVDTAQKKLSDTQSSGQQILDELKKRVNGAASAYGDTLKGKVDAAKAGLENMGEVLGKKLIPVIASAIGVAQKFVGWLGDHTPVLYVVAAVIGTVLVTAIGAWIASLVKGAYDSAVNFAKMIASGAVWVAQTAAQIATSVAGFATWAAEGIAKAVAAAAVGFASMVASAASWLATQAVQLAQSLAGFVAWAAEHAIMAAGFIAQNVAMAASATAAFIAENAATLGIVAAIGLIVSAIVWLATHWGQAWDAIKTAAKWAYDNVIKPVADFIVNNVIHPIASAVSGLGKIWGDIWGGIKSVIKDVGGVIGAVLGGIVSGIQTMIGWISKAIGWFESLFGAANDANRAATNAYGAANRAAQAAQINTNTGTILGNLSQAHFPSHDIGGWINAPRGAPQLGINHGGEYMLSLDMLAGRQRIDPKVVAAIDGQATSMSQRAVTGATPTPAAAGAQVTVIAHTNASPVAIASQVGWVMRGMA